MERMYFTFGSDEKFPYGMDQYLVVIGKDRRDCINAFKERYPSDADGVMCCSDYYNEKLWNSRPAQTYKGVEPSEVIITDEAYGCKPKGFGELWFYVLEKNTLIYLQEGSGDNLLKEDIDAGYVDYLDMTAYELDNGIPEETDGGQMMTTYLIQEHYKCLADSIPDVLDFLFDDPLLDAQILRKV